MLLKIVRYDDRQNWWMFDDIRKVSVSNRLFKGEATEETIRCNFDAIFFDMPECSCGPGDGCNDCKDYIVLICRMNDGNEYCVAFDTIAYILNDSGKTIEKIVANYNE